MCLYSSGSCSCLHTVSLVLSRRGSCNRQQLQTLLLRQSLHVQTGQTCGSRLITAHRGALHLKIKLPAARIVKIIGRNLNEMSAEPKSLRIMRHLFSVKGFSSDFGRGRRHGESNRGSSCPTSRTRPDLHAVSWCGGSGQIQRSCRAEHQQKEYNKH